MFGLLPAIVLVGCVAALLSARGRLGAALGVREAVPLGIAAVALWAALGGELLSIGRHLSFGPLLAWWGIPAAGLAFLLPRGIRELKVAASRAARPDPLTATLIGVTAVILVATAIAAILTPPNTWDAVTYHMPRQVFWMNQASLAHYPAQDLRQLEFPPLVESAGVQVLILAGGDDRWSNLVHWSTFLGCVLLASVIARDLGAGARGQAIASLLVATYPAAVQQAANVKNDVALALWALLLVWVALRIRRDRVCGWFEVLAAGVAGALLLYTKGTAYLFALPLGLLLGVAMLRALGVRAVPLAGAMAAIVLAINAGHWRRNYETFGHPLGNSAAGRGYKISNETMAPAAIASTVIRNLALHTAAPSRSFNDAQTRWIGAMHEPLGIAPDDPRTSTPPGVEFRVKWRLDEDNHVGAPFHLLIAIVAPLGLAFAASRAPPAAGAHDWRPVLAVFCVGVAMFLLFCAVLKWQQWHPRLHIPIAAVLAPACGAMLPRASGRGFGLVKAALVFAAAGLGLMAALLSDAKPLLGAGSIAFRTRDEVLFHYHQAALPQVRSALEVAERYRPAVLGISRGIAGCEYGMQRLAMDTLRPRPLIVTGRPFIGPKVPDDAPEPDVTLAWGATARSLIFRQGGSQYIPVAQFLPVTVYVRHDRLGPMPPDYAAMPFIGWTEREGLSDAAAFPEGHRSRMVRYGVGPGAALQFESDGRGASLVLECRCMFQHQTFDVLLNGKPVYAFTAGYRLDFQPHRIPLAATRGRNLIEIRARLPDRPIGVNELSIAYSRIQVVPETIP